MYAVQTESFIIFTGCDPRGDGYEGPVTEGVALHFPDGSFRWRDCDERPRLHVGHAPDDPTLFVVFRAEEHLVGAGYVPVQGSPEVFDRWADFRAFCGA